MNHPWRDKTKEFAKIDMGLLAFGIVMAIFYSSEFAGTTNAVRENDIVLYTYKGELIVSNGNFAKTVASWNAWIVVGIFILSSFLQLCAASRLLCTANSGRDAIDLLMLIEDYIYCSYAFMICGVMCGFVFGSYFLAGLWLLGRGLFHYIIGKVMAELKLNSIPYPI